MVRPFRDGSLSSYICIYNNNKPHAWHDPNHRCTPSLTAANQYRFAILGMFIQVLNHHRIPRLGSLSLGFTGLRSVL